MKVIANHAKRRILNGELALGMGLRQARTVDIAQIASSCDFDWLFIDMEHNSMSVDTAAQICQAALGVGITPMIRVPAHEAFHSTRLLDTGAQGIVIPHVSTQEQARAVVNFCRFTPLGNRSIPGSLPQTRFMTLPVTETVSLINAETLVVAMIETVEGRDNVDAIASVPGIDVLLVGCTDMAAELGVAGQLGHPSVKATLDTVFAACRKHGKACGVGGVYDEALMAEYIQKGARLILSGSDLAFLMAGARSRSSTLRSIDLSEQTVAVA
ncbi:aldolase/citrate lyase family protein [Variovorax sp. J22R133]|uniref:HpcH/HpaI aldolase family protein n=1 Tax=Variovorax brevis TaxID=3053503 RepID=UPI0025772F99|nr:aldolase/citrate lyase family protein [Variovorax sp. J22R133]MDM0116409.1 aldolase/citrate lyase family protein [Variovorax sp. J22R133]